MLLILTHSFVFHLISVHQGGCVLCALIAVVDQFFSICSPDSGNNFRFICSAAHPCSCLKITVWRTWPLIHPLQDHPRRRWALAAPDDLQNVFVIRLQCRSFTRSVFQERFTIGEAFLDPDLRAQINAALQEDEQIPLDFAAHRIQKWANSETVNTSVLRCFISVCFK